VIIGAGVMGASAAYHLARRGVRDILVLDRFDRPGLGSTGKATGGFRVQFASDVNVRLSLLAREKLLRFRDETGVDPGYRPCGYLFLARTEAELAPLRRAMTVQRAAGVRARGYPRGGAAARGAGWRARARGGLPLPGSQPRHLPLARLAGQEHPLGHALLDDLAIQVRAPEELLMIAARHDPPPLEHHDLVGQ